MIFTASQTGSLQELEGIKKILDQYVDVDVDSVPMHASIPDLCAPLNNVSDISPYLKFVSRENEIKKLIENMENLYEVAKNPKRYQEPRKYLRFSAVTGTAGKGKTTFAQRAYERTDVLITCTKESIIKHIEECTKAGRSFRVSCREFFLDEYSENHEHVFGRRLLYEALKYRLNG